MGHYVHFNEARFWFPIASADISNMSCVQLWNSSEKYFFRVIELLAKNHQRRHCNAPDMKVDFCWLPLVWNNGWHLFFNWFSAYPSAVSCDLTTFSTESCEHNCQLFGTLPNSLGFNAVGTGQHGGRQWRLEGTNLNNFTISILIIDWMLAQLSPVSENTQDITLTFGIIISEEHISALWEKSPYSLWCSFISGFLKHKNFRRTWDDYLFINSVLELDRYI